MLIRESITIIATILGSVLAIVIYIIPSYIAYNRKHNNKVAILIINILLGWTLVGYILSLIWALYGEGSKNLVRKQF